MRDFEIKLIPFRSDKVFSEVEDAIDKNEEFAVTIKTSIGIYPSIIRIIRSIITGETRGFIQNSWDTFRTGSLLAAIMLAQEHGYKVGVRPSTITYEIFFVRCLSHHNLKELEMIPDLDDLQRSVGS
jgi:hypothetical protein